MWCHTRINIRNVIIFNLLFIIYITNDLNQASDILDPIMFVDDTNFFHSHKYCKTLFHTVNTELVKVNHLFKANKLSLNAKKELIIPFFTKLKLKTNKNTFKNT